MAGRGKKPSLAILIGAGKPGRPGSEDEESPDSGEGEDMSSHKVELAKEILSAVKADDAEKLAKALCALQEVHDSDPEEGDYSEEDMGDEDEDEEG